MLRRLCDKGICENKDGHVSTVISKEEIAAIKTDKLMEEDFGGSLPRFLAAFADRKKLSESEIDEIQQMIDRFRKTSYKKSIPQMKKIKDFWEE